MDKQSPFLRVIKTTQKELSSFTQKQEPSANQMEQYQQKSIKQFLNSNNSFNNKARNSIIMNSTNSNFKNFDPNQNQGILIKHKLQKDDNIDTIMMLVVLKKSLYVQLNLNYKCQRKQIYQNKEIQNLKQFYSLLQT